MRTERLFPAVLLSAALKGGLGRTADPDPPRVKLTPAELSQAEKAVKAYLEKVKGSHAVVTPIRDETLARVLPGQAFFGVLFRQLPAGRLPPRGLGPANVLVVTGDKVEPLTDVKELELHFRTRLPLLGADEGLKDAARAWLKLSQHLHQDGFYKFQIDDSTEVISNKTTKIAVGKSNVLMGGTGLISARLIFDMSGRLMQVSEDSKLRPDPRPEP
jgi:hypothetical protein